MLAYIFIVFNIFINFSIFSYKLKLTNKTNNQTMCKHNNDKNFY